MQPRLATPLALLAAAFAVAGAAALGGCADAAALPSLRVPPQSLADTGLYADFAARRVAPDVWPFEPQYPLWTDGAAKQRWIHVPAGSSIDASDPDAWVFPVGTKLWKEFAFERRVETRYLEKLDDGTWMRVSYLWNADESDALLAPAGGVRGAAEAAPGVPYDVPSRTDCGTCHARGDGVLGFGALQLSPDRDPLAPHARRDVPPGQDLDAFVSRSLVTGLPQELLDTPPRVRARGPRERAALGYLSANCGSCHHGGGLLAGLGLTLDARLGDAAPRALESTVERASRFRPPTTTSRDDGLTQQTCDVRLRPGAPEQSSLFHRMATRTPSAQMPPLGTRLPDREALALLEAWIRDDLPATSDQPFPSSRP